MAGGVGAAGQVLQTLDAEAAVAAREIVSSAFVDSITRTLRFGIIFAVLSGVAGFILIPNRQRIAQMGQQVGQAATAAPAQAVAAAAAAPERARLLVTAVFATALARAQKTAP